MPHMIYSKLELFWMTAINMRQTTGKRAAESARSGHMGPRYGEVTFIMQLYPKEP